MKSILDLVEEKMLERIRKQQEAELEKQQELERQQQEKLQILQQEIYATLDLDDIEHLTKMGLEYKLIGKYEHKYLASFIYEGVKIKFFSYKIYMGTKDEKTYQKLNGSVKAPTF